MEGISLITNTLLERKKGSLCILISLCVLSIYIIFDSDNQTNRSSAESYTVSIRHYGVDAREIERSITIPLEDALYSIPGVINIQSSSENNLSRVFIKFKNYKKFQYEAVREATQRIYEELPSSVQRPEIHSSDNSMIPVWAAAFYGTHDNSVETALYLEKFLKPKLESLDGVGEVHISGSNLSEIVIAVDQKKAASLGLSSSTIAKSLYMNDDLFFGGTMVCDGREIIVTVDSRSEYENVFITIESGKVVKLSDIALVIEQERLPDTISRLNGKKVAVVSIMSNSGADLRKLSKEINCELQVNKLPLTFVVLSDKGSEEANAFKSVFFAALQGAVMVVIVCFFINKKGNILKTKNANIFCAIFVPVICLVSVSLLLLCNFSLDRYLLAGIAVGVGSAIYPALLCCERLRNCINYIEAKVEIKKLFPVLIAGALTTIVSLFPLSVIDLGIKNILWAIGTVTLLAFILSITLLPPLLLWNIKSGNIKTCSKNLSTAFGLKFIQFLKKRIGNIFCFKIDKPSHYKFYKLINKVNRKFIRLFTRNIRFIVSYPTVTCFTGLILIIIGITVLVIRGSDIEINRSSDSVFGHVEFNGSLLIDETDRILAEYTISLLKYQGIINVQTEARVGSGSILISFDQKKLNNNEVQDIAKSIPLFDGFIYFPEASAKKRHWEIKIFGDDDRLLKELALNLAFIINNSSLIIDQVLNFKENSKILRIIPNFEKTNETKNLFINISNIIRNSIYGPVIYKKNILNREIDVRMKTGNFFDNLNGISIPYKKDINELIIISDKNSGPIQLESLIKIIEENGLSSIRRENRRRFTSITISTLPMDPRYIKSQLNSIFQNFSLPSGYIIEFDAEAIEKAQAVSKIVFLLFISILFCYMLIAAINESFILPIIIISAIPISLSVPIIFISIINYPINIKTACAFVVVSGIAINSAILCALNFRQLVRIDNKGYNLYKILRKQLPALISTTFITISSAVPFLFLKEDNNSFIKILSIITILGIFTSSICAISIIPSLFIKFYLKRQKE